MKLGKYKTPLFIGVLILIFIAISLIFRVKLPYDSVFVNSWVKFTSNDAYYHMRLVENIVHNFPHLTAFDPYSIFPGGSPTGSIHFMDYLVAAIIWIIGLGHPTQRLIDVVGAWFPSVIAALTVIPVFFIGKALFNKWVGVMAAFLVAILPGEFLGRSILAFTDNHVVETFFSTIAALFVILAVKSGAEHNLKLENIRDWKIIWKPLLYSVLGGLFLGLYLITWQGALLFVFIITVFFIVQFIINHLNHKPNDHLGLVGPIVFLIAGLFFWPQSPANYYSLALVIALFIPVVLALISRLMNRPKINVAFYPPVIIIIAIVMVLIVLAASPNTVHTLWSNFRFVFSPGGGSTATTTMEMQPFLSPSGAFSTQVAWGNFTSSFFLFKGAAIPGFGLISLALLIWYITKQKEPSNLKLVFRILSLIMLVVFYILLYSWGHGGNSTVLIIFLLLFLSIFFILLVWLSGSHDTFKEPILFFVLWSIIILIATLVQRRFAYYLVVNIAVLSAYISYQIIWYAGLRRVKEKATKAIEEKVETAKPKAKKKPQRASQEMFIYYVGTIAAILAVFFCVDFWNLNESDAVAKSAPYAPTDGWMQALTWMQTNTPEPLGDPNAYYKLYNTDYKYPDSAYGVTTWWDYGYWVSVIAKRLPSVNPSQAPDPITKTANLFLSTNATESDALMDEMKSDYIIADSALITSKLWAVANWAGQSQNKYFTVYYINQNGQYKPAQVYTPDFYRSLIVRLFSFDGKAVTDSKPIVVTWESVTQGGTTIRVVTKADQYPSYAAAQAYIASQKTGNYDIVGSNPFVNIVPLDPVTNFKEVFASPSTVSFSGNITIPDIKVFQHVK